MTVVRPPDCMYVPALTVTVPPVVPPVWLNNPVTPIVPPPSIDPAVWFRAAMPDMVEPVATLTVPAVLRLSSPTVTSPPPAIMLISAPAWLSIRPGPTGELSSLASSVAVPPGPLKLMIPVLVISPASVTVPPVPTLRVPPLFSVFPVPCSVEKAVTLIVPVVLLITPASRVAPTVSESSSPILVTPVLVRVPILVALLPSATLNPPVRLLPP